MKELLAEFFGTFWWVFGGCGSALFATGYPELGIGYTGIALAFGLTVLTMAYAVGPISGGILILQFPLVYGLEDVFLQKN